MTVLRYVSYCSAFALLVCRSYAQIACGPNASFLQSGDCACDFGYVRTDTSPTPPITCAVNPSKSCIQYAPATAATGYAGSYILSLEPGASASTNATMQAGATYTVTFLASAAAASSLSITIGGSVISSSAIASIGALAPYESATFIAPSSSTLIKLTNTGSANEWVDYVRFEPLTAVPPEITPPPLPNPPSPPPYAAPVPSPPPYAVPVLTSRGMTTSPLADTITNSLALDPGAKT